MWCATTTSIGQHLWSLQPCASSYAKRIPHTRHGEGSSPTMIVCCSPTDLLDMVGSTSYGQGGLSKMESTRVVPCVVDRFMHPTRPACLMGWRLLGHRSRLCAGPLVPAHNLVGLRSGRLDGATAIPAYESFRVPMDSWRARANRSMRSMSGVQSNVGPHPTSDLEKAVRAVGTIRPGHSWMRMCLSLNFGPNHPIHVGIVCTRYRGVSLVQ
jgi:hypothetical protein